MVYIRAPFQTVLQTISHLNHDGNIGDVETCLKIIYNYTILIRTRKDTAGIGLCIQDFLFFSFFITWRLITLQYCSGFCHTLT